MIQSIKTDINAQFMFENEAAETHINSELLFNTQHVCESEHVYGGNLHLWRESAEIQTILDSALI